jgi:hypothetical protein
MSVIFKYGDYEFDPKPAFSINVDNLKTPDGSGYGRKYTVDIEGSLLLQPNQAISGVVGVFQKIEDLKDALNQDGKLFIVSCNDNPIISGYPIIGESLSVEKREDNFARRADYKFAFEMPTLTGGDSGDHFNNSIIPPFIESASESWSVDFEEERMPFDWSLSGNFVEKFGYKLAITHDVDVQARAAYDSSENLIEPWKSAKSYAETRLGFDNDMVTLTGILGIPRPDNNYFTAFDVFNQYRNVQIDKSNGSVKVSETFIVTPSGSNSLPNNAIETFSIDVNKEEGITSVSIDGEIQGLAKITYDPSGIFKQESSKFAAASGYYKLVESTNRFYLRSNRAYQLAKDNCDNQNLSHLYTSKAVGLNPIDGTITYNYNFDNNIRCFTDPCIVSQNITIDDSLKQDVFAEQVVIGRAIGPIIQDINTKTARTRTVTVEIVTRPSTGCSSYYDASFTGNVESLINTILNQVSGVQFVSENRQNWNITNGRYTRTKGIVYGEC